MDLPHGGGELPMLVVVPEVGAFRDFEGRFDSVVVVAW